MQWKIRSLLLAASLTACHPSSAKAPIDPASLPNYPSAVSLIDEGDHGLVFRQSETSRPLYTYDRDRPGRSTCYGPCAAAWPSLQPSADDKPVGDWTIIARTDGSRQWAYRGRPVYLRDHDTAEHQTADSLGGIWHALVYRPKAP